MEGLGITASSGASIHNSKHEAKRWNGNAAMATTPMNKGKSSRSKSSSDAATSYIVSKIDAGQAVLISDQVGLNRSMDG